MVKIATFWMLLAGYVHGKHENQQVHYHRQRVHAPSVHEFEQMVNLHRGVEMEFKREYPREVRRMALRKTAKTIQSKVTFALGVLVY